MVSGFLGTLIALERAVALGRAWAYAAPLCTGLGALVVVAGLLRQGLGLMTAGAAVLVAASALVLARHRSLETAALFAGALAWLAGHLAMFAGLAPVPWWFAFFALTIGGERLELSRYLKRGPAARSSFLVLVAALCVAPLAPRLLGVTLVALSVWLFAFDLARVTVRRKALARYTAVCLLAGYFWLAAGGVLVALGLAYDAALHAIFVGFVLSMVFGHAPVILPAVLRKRLPYSPFLYLPLALLHASLAVRILVSTALGAWGNAAAIVLFIATAATLALAAKR